MILDLHLAEEVPSFLPQRLYQDIFQMTFSVVNRRTAGGFRISGKKVTLHAVALSEKKIRQLNRRYRKNDRSTDILSFGEVLESQRGSFFLGELFFSPDYIRKEALKDGGGYRENVIFIFSHGILHLLGYDHGKQMFAYQDEVTRALSRSRQKKHKTS